MIYTTTDLFMLGLLATGAVSSVAYLIFIIVAEIKRRKFEKQIKEGEIPRDYSRLVKKAQQEQNESIISVGIENETRNLNILNLRGKVALIRVNGYDAAVLAKEQGLTFAGGLERSPYVKGTGSAQQWVRGYCQASGQPPKEWMDRA